MEHALAEAQYARAPFTWKTRVRRRVCLCFALCTRTVEVGGRRHIKYTHSVENICLLQRVATAAALAGTVTAAVTTATLAGAAQEQHP